jgi:hypothetical protein
LFVSVFVMHVEFESPRFHPIFQALSMTESGCRSNLYKHCNNNNVNTDDTTTESGGIIIDFLHEPQRLIDAEWGEGRTTRLEENGARTPLVIEVPPVEEGAATANISDGSTATTTTTTNNNNSNKRLEKPFQLIYWCWIQRQRVEIFYGNCPKCTNCLDWSRWPSVEKPMHGSNSIMTLLFLRNYCNPPDWVVWPLFQIIGCNSM